MWRRALAFLIDLMPFAVLFGVENAAGIAHYELIGIPNLLLWLLYFAGMNYRYGGTWGKQVMGLRVALPQSPNVLVQLIVRAFIKLFCLGGMAFPPFFWVYGLMGIWRVDGRMLHDFAGGTTVVDAVSLTVPRPPNTLERLSASFLLVIAPFVFVILLMTALFGVAIFQEIMKS